MEKNQRLKAAILQVVENQIISNDPPETQQTLDRLVSEGFSDQEARNLIGTVVAAEFFNVMQGNRPFDITRYVNALNNLPEAPK